TLKATQRIPAVNVELKHGYLQQSEPEQDAEVAVVIGRCHLIATSQRGDELPVGDARSLAENRDHRLQRAAGPQEEQALADRVEADRGLVVACRYLSPHVPDPVRVQGPPG